MLYPIINKELNTITEVLAPNLSIKNPPVNGNIQFGS